ncbi:MAG: Zn-dependent exopeptidase M28 [Chlorobi bacterium]|nr:Zn-dependent exopeptidase M28 [Chlorobiota bacterium]
MQFIKALFATALLLISLSGFSQNIQYAKSIVDSFTSPSFHGRGYVNDGEKTAAEFIAGEFEKSKLKLFGESYFQAFALPMNTFPDTIDVFVDGKRLVPGRDFVLSSSSPSFDGEFEMLWFMKDTSGVPRFDKNMDTTSIDRKVIVTDMNARKFPYENHNPKGYVFLQDEKTMWHVSDGWKVKDFFSLQIVESKISRENKILRLKYKNRFFEEYPTQNVIGYIEGKKRPNSYFVFTAHYDHLGQMGPEAYFPGGNDNASGSAMLLDLVRYYSQSENQPDISIAFMAFSAEEAGLLGSRFYTENPLFPLKQIKFLVNLDMVGSGSKGIKVVNGSVFKKQFDKLVKINRKNEYLLKVNTRGEAANSDHYFFYEKGVPSFFIYTLGPECIEYHNIYDDSKNVPFTEYEDLFRLLVEFEKTFK